MESAFNRHGLSAWPMTPTGCTSRRKTPPATRQPRKYTLSSRPAVNSHCAASVRCWATRFLAIFVSDERTITHNRCIGSTFMTDLTTATIVAALILVAAIV